FFVLALLTKEGFSHFSIIGALLCLGAAIWIDQSTPSTSATTPSSTQAVAPAHEPLDAPRRYRIVLPKGASFEPEAARKLMEYLLRTSGHLALQIVAEHQTIHFEVTDCRSGVHL